MGQKELTHTEHAATHQPPSEVRDGQPPQQGLMYSEEDIGSANVM